MDMDTVPSPAKLLKDATKAMEGLRPVAVYRPLPVVYDASTRNIMGAKAVPGEGDSPPLQVDIVAPSVSFSVSAPNMLPQAFRKSSAIVLWVLTAITVLTSAIVATKVDGASGATAVVSLAVIAIIMVTISYFVIMGFGKVDYSAGLQGAPKEKDGEEDTEEQASATGTGQGSKPGEAGTKAGSPTKR